MQLKYVVKRRKEKDSDVVHCTLKCGKLELATFAVTESRTTLASGKLKRDYTVTWDKSILNVQFEKTHGKRYKASCDAEAAVQKLFAAQLSKLEAE